MLYAAQVPVLTISARWGTEPPGEIRLVRGVGRRMRSPVLLRKFDAPEMRAGAQEFNSDARALLGSVSQINDAALLLFLSRGIDEHDIRTELQFLIQIEQAAVGVDHDRLAFRAKSLAEDVLALRLDRDPREYPGTASLATGLRFWHRPIYRAVWKRPSQSCGLGTCPKKQFSKVC